MLEALGSARLGNRPPPCQPIDLPGHDAHVARSGPPHGGDGNAGERQPEPEGRGITVRAVEDEAGHQGPARPAQAAVDAAIVPALEDIRGVAPNTDTVPYPSTPCAATMALHSCFVPGLDIPSLYTDRLVTRKSFFLALPRVVA